MGKDIHPKFEFWSIKKNPFRDFVIDNSNSHLFINRKDELDSLNSYLDGGIIGVFGNSGIGKSSLVNYFIYKTEKPVNIKCIYVNFFGFSDEVFFRKILYETLIVLKKESIDVSLFNLEDKIKNIEYSIDFTEGNNTVKPNISSANEPNSESSAIEDLHSIISSMDGDFCFVLDNAERLRESFDSIAKYSGFVSKIINKIETKFLDALVYITLDIEYVMRLCDNNLDDLDKVSLGFRDFIYVKNLSTYNIAEIIFKRLVDKGWKGRFVDFLEPNALFLLNLKYEGHPRVFFKNIDRLMSYIYNNRDKYEPKITVDIVLEFFKNYSKPIDNFVFQLYEFITQNGRVYGSQEELKKLTSKSDSRISEKLNALTDDLILISEFIHPKKFYFFPEIDF